MRKIKEIEKLKNLANLVRQDIIKMISQAKSGHPAGALGMADVFVALYFNLLNHRPHQPRWKMRDRLILSNGHICAVQYAVMARCGYFPLSWLSKFRKIGSPLQGHPHNLSLPGLEISSGSLGHGLSIAAGMAWLAQFEKKKYQVFCLTSDGEQNEGSTWEAAMFAAKYKLGHLIQIMDRNGIQLSGKTQKIMPLEPLKEKYEAFGWKVLEISGHDFKEIFQAIEIAKNYHFGPVLIIAQTIPGKGVSFMENKSLWHGKALTKTQAKKALLELRRS